MLYLDASALVKRYVVEPGSDDLLEAMNGASAWAMCRVGFVETVRAVVVAGEEADVKRVEEDWKTLYIVDVDQALTESAVQLAISHRLRSLDALHLAAALVLPGGDLTFATWDSRLHDAACGQGLATLPAELG
jgi:predicted nucleic acid-binding protein